MSEDLIFKVVGGVGFFGLVLQAANGVVQNFKEKYRPDIIYELDDKKGREASEEHRVAE